MNNIFKDSLYHSRLFFATVAILFQSIPNVRIVSTTRSTCLHLLSPLPPFQDAIQCAGAALVAAVRADAALAEKAAHDKRRGEGIDSNHNSSSSSSSSSSSEHGATPPPYYALHVRRGDFQFKEVKISAEEIIKNVKGNAIIPRGSIVYVSTDDPKGVCVGCTYKKKPCPTGPEAAAIVGCIEDPSWDAFRTKAG